MSDLAVGLGLFLLRAAALLVCFWGVYGLLGSHPRARVALCRIVSVAIVLLPLIHFLPMPEIVSVPRLHAERVREMLPRLEILPAGGTIRASAPPAGHPPRANDFTPAAAADGPPIQPVSVKMPKPAELSISGMLIGAWLGVAGLLAGRWGVLLFMARSLARRAESPPPRVSALAVDLCGELGIRRALALGVTDAVCSPVLLGPAPVILLPPRLGEEDARAALAHELVHFRRGDWHWSQWMHVVAILVWPVPLGWPLRRAHDAASEVVCDHVSAALIGGAESYAGSLARQSLRAVGRFNSATLPMLRRSGIRARIERLLSGVELPSLSRRVVLVAGASTVLVCTALGGFRLARAADEAANSARKKPEPAAAVVAADEKPAASDDFMWFGSLGYPDVKGLKFVRFTASWYRDERDGGKVKPLWNYAFVLSETPEKMRVLPLNFVARDVLKNRPPEFDPEMPATVVEPADLKAYAESVLASPPEDPSALSRIMGERWTSLVFESRTAVFALAWACSRQGLDDLAARLHAKAQKMSGSVPEEDLDPADWTFRRRLEWDVACFEMNSIELDMGNPAIPRPQVLERLERFRANFPKAHSTARANELMADLKRAIAEDAAHPKLTAAQIAKLPAEEQAKEWIFQLRDHQPGGQTFPGSVSVLFVSKRGEDGKWKEAKDTPARHLLAMGDAAVPALLDAFDDDHLTRAGGMNQRFGLPTQVITVGEAAQEILREIARRRFPNKSAAVAWWTTRNEKGEAAELAEATAKGDEGSASAGYQLFEKYPDQAAAPLLAGMKATESAYTRSELVQLAERLDKNLVPDSMLLKWTAESQPLGGRMQAAYDLARRGNTDAIPSLAKAWTKMKFLTEEDEGYDSGTREALIGLLAVVDSPVGINALAKGLAKCDEETRQDVLMALSPGMGMLMVELNFNGPRPKGKSSAATETAIETLLAGELQDVLGHGPSGGENDVKFPEGTRLCDQAASLMSQRWPDRYKFTTTGTIAERDKQRLACLDTWRATQRLKPQGSLPAH